MTEDFSEIKWFLCEIEKKYPFFKKSKEYIDLNFKKNYLEFSNVILKDYFGNDVEKKSKAIDSFIKYSNEFLFLQVKLKKTGRYLYQTFSEIEENVYQSKLMDDYYLDGLLLSQFFWPNHYKILEHLQCHVANSSYSSVLDAPCGSGLQAAVIASEIPGAKIDCVDLSPFSLNFTRRLIDGLGMGHKSLTYKVQNIFDTTGKYDFICCGELLEHLESPTTLLATLKSLLNQDGRIYLTTAIYAAAIDHLYLFHSVKEVRDMIKEFFYIESEIILPVSLKQFNEEIVDEPINYAAILKHRCVE